MAAPILSAPAAELLDALDPAFTAGDELRGYPAANLCAALVVGDLEQIWSYVTDGEDGSPGWQILLDPDGCPPEALPYLSQFAGATLRPDMDVDQVRDAIRSPEVFRRGSPAAIVAVTQRRLTGSKTVLLTERYTGNAYRIKVDTIGTETPDPAATQAEIIAEAKPIGVRLFFNTTVPWTWAELRAEKATWATVEADFATWLLARTHVP